MVKAAMSILGKAWKSSGCWGGEASETGKGTVCFPFDYAFFPFQSKKNGHKV